MEMKLKQEDIEQIRFVNQAASEAAAQSLTKMINKETKVTYPAMSLKPLEEVKKLQDENLLAICEVTGDVKGNLIIAYTLETGLKLVDHIMSEPIGTNKELTEDVKSAYKEFVNIIGGSYLSNMANFLGFKIFPEVPNFIGKLTEVQSEIMTELSSEVGKMLMIKTQLEIEDEKLAGHFFIILDESSLQKILTTIREGA